MLMANCDNLIDWVRYVECDEAVTVSAGLIRAMATELKAARRVVGYVSVSKSFLAEDDYHDLVREVASYEALFADE